MKVYALVLGEYCGMTDRAYIYGVYSSWEKADEAAKSFSEYVHKNSTIEEIDLDAAPEELRIV